MSKTNARFAAFCEYPTAVPWANSNRRTPKNPPIRMTDALPVELAPFRSSLTRRNPGENFPLPSRTAFFALPCTEDYSSVLEATRNSSALEIKAIVSSTDRTKEVMQQPCEVHKAYLVAYRDIIYPCSASHRKSASDTVGSVQSLFNTGAIEITFRIRSSIFMP